MCNLFSIRCGTNNPFYTLACVDTPTSDSNCSYDGNILLSSLIMLILLTLWLMWFWFYLFFSDKLMKNKVRFRYKKSLFYWLLFRIFFQFIFTKKIDNWWLFTLSFWWLLTLLILEQINLSMKIRIILCYFSKKLCKNVTISFRYQNP